MPAPPSRRRLLRPCWAAWRSRPATPTHQGAGAPDPAAVGRVGPRMPPRGAAPGRRRPAGAVHCRRRAPARVRDCGGILEGRPVEGRDRMGHGVDHSGDARCPIILPPTALSAASDRRTRFGGAHWSRWRRGAGPRPRNCARWPRLASLHLTTGRHRRGRGDPVTICWCGASLWSGAGARPPLRFSSTALSRRCARPSTSGTPPWPRGARLWGWASLLPARPRPGGRHAAGRGSAGPRGEGGPLRPEGLGGRREARPGSTGRTEGGWDP